MKKTTYNSKFRFVEIAFLSISLISAITLTLPSCNQSKPEDTKEVAEDQNEAKFENALEDYAKFLVNAAEINLEQIQLGELAQTKGTATHVKKLGKMMVDEHTKALADLNELAAKKQIIVPTTITDDGKSAVKNLMDTKVSNFDKEYATMMVKGHENAISKFEKASENAKDADIRNWATTMLPSLRTHLNESKICKEQCEKNN